MQHYSEALKRGPPAVNPEAYKLFSNRAACFTKLGAYPDGIKDADECISLKPDFAKGYSRKGHLQFFMKDYDKAIATYQVCCCPFLWSRKQSYAACGAGRSERLGINQMLGGFQLLDVFFCSGHSSTLTMRDSIKSLQHQVFIGYGKGRSRRGFSGCFGVWLLALTLRSNADASGSLCRVCAVGGSGQSRQG